VSGSIQNAFINTWSPYAQQAGSTLGVDPNILLSQWANESAWGTSNLAVNSGNLAGIGGPGNFAVYSTPQAFTNAFVNLVQNTYNKAVGTGSDLWAYISGLNQGGANGNLSYYGKQSASSYYGNIAPIYNQMGGSASTTAPTTTGAQTTSSLGDALSWLWKWANRNDPNVDPKTGSVNWLGEAGYVFNLEGFTLRLVVAILGFIFVIIGVAAIALKSEPLAAAATIVEKVK
jgi:hypothetical protein